MNIVPFEFNSHEVRSVLGDNGEPLFNAKDVCDCLEIANSRDAIKRLDDEDLVSVKATSGGQKREMNFVNESGLYHLIFSSYKEEAKAFKRWVTREVLPSIRKTGSYSLGGLSDSLGFYGEYRQLNPNFEFSITYDGVEAAAYRDATHGLLINAVELAKLIGKSPVSIRVMKRYHKDIIIEGDAFVKLGEKTYFTRKGVEIIALHSHNTAFARYVLTHEFSTALLRA